MSIKTIVTGLLMAGGLMTAKADTTKPWTFWYWMYGAVSKAGIKADLQAMKDVGLGGCYLMPIRGTDDAAQRKAAAKTPGERFPELP